LRFYERNLVTLAQAALLVLAGVGAGLCGSIAGLASLVSYPALLAFGLPPLAANVTNTVAMLGTTVGSIAGSQRELEGNGPRIRTLVTQSAAGGLLGAGLLLLTPASAFEVVVPWLVAFGALLLMTRDRIRTLVSRRHRSVLHGPGAGLFWTVVIVLVGIYGGYFGAGVGIIFLAALGIQTSEPLAVTNALKNVGSGTANAVAALIYVCFGPVDWAAAAALGAGAVLGSWLGPAIVRVAPERLLRYLIAAAGLGLAMFLAIR
jgi:uncharacterized protein